ncbi:MAG: TfoX/Sxy family protein [Donghicola eburneus]|nr:TfoX/Sxy family DNA transformation protein [Donghicola eburneus]MCI5039067.1 TfoX/Sxy family protein [Donghicola eburneus]
MATPVTSIKYIGPAQAKALAAAGIHDAETLRDVGAHEAYGRMLASGHSPHFISYYALVMALQGRPWNDCKGQEKDDLRVAFDDLKDARHDKGRSKLEAALDVIGVIDPKIRR